MRFWDSRAALLSPRAGRGVRPSLIRRRSAKSASARSPEGEGDTPPANRPAGKLVLRASAGSPPSRRQEAKNTPMSHGTAEIFESKVGSNCDYKSIQLLIYRNAKIS